MEIANSGGGTTLPLSSPHSSNWASHSQSRMSVLRPEHASHGRASTSIRRKWVSHGLLVHVEARAPFDHYVHLPSRAEGFLARAGALRMRFCRTRCRLSRAAFRTAGFPEAPRVMFGAGLPRTSILDDLCPRQA